MHISRHLLHCVIPSIVFIIVVLSYSIFSCGFSTGSSVHKQQSADVSEWIGDYQGTAKFVAAKKRINENEWDPQWIKRRSMDGKTQSIEIKIFHAPDNMVHLELHMEYPIVSFDPRNPSTSISYVYYHLNPSLLSSNTINANQGIEGQSYDISLTRELTTITGTLGGQGWHLGGVYQLNFGRKATEKK